MARIAAVDPELGAILQREEVRQSQSLTLIASENHSSPAVREACASLLTDKYAEGYPGARYYGGCENADLAEDLARRRALQLFAGTEHVNVQPHSGTTANLAVLTALARPGGRILGMALNAGGHLSHGHGVSHTGIVFQPVHYGVDPATGLIQLEEVRRLAREHQPKVILAGASSYPRAIDYPGFAAIAREVGAVLVADIAHPAGLIATGVMPSPVGHAEVVTTTTHKTLRGPRGGMIFCRKDLAKPIDSAVFPGAQGGPLMHQIAAKALAFGEALRPEFRAYQQRVKENAVHLAACLADRGLRIVTGGTDCHLILVDLRTQNVSGAEVEARCRTAGLAVNKNMIPGDPRPPKQTSGLRVGTPAVTTRGMGRKEMEGIAEVIAGVVQGKEPESFRARIGELARAFPLP
ncbi:MAG: serine hydroxymethyltransferase [Planctomycetes bacterium]|nr:serine hydroxymethyltransferase [Planctomycetota bacterium]